MCPSFTEADAGRTSDDEVLLTPAFEVFVVVLHTPVATSLSNYSIVELYVATRYSL